jgi:beta-glucanase (GH16 family)
MIRAMSKASPRQTALFVLTTVAVSAGGCRPPGTEPAANAGDAVAGWRLVWADEFEGDGLPDSTRWGYDVGGHGWGNDELQYYTERRPENARIAAGRLVIEARREPMEGREYTSARLVTKGRGDWLYGRIEARARLPSGRGTWPAIWMLPTEWRYGGWPESGEIDIMEHVGHDPDVVHATVHTAAYNHLEGTQVGAARVVPTARAAFHVYAVEWTPAEIRGYIDGIHYFSFPNERLSSAAATHREWPFDQPFHLVLNVAVGGGWGGAEGVDPDIWPQRMEVDYVRVYRWED